MTGQQLVDRLHFHARRLPLIKVDPARKSVATTETLALCRFVDEARSKGLAPAVVSLVPRHYRDVVYLDVLPSDQALWPSWNRRLVEYVIRPTDGKRLRENICAEIDEETYRHRVCTAQEFRFHTHLNTDRKVSTPAICGQTQR